MNKDNIIPFIMDGQVIGWQTKEDAAVMKDICDEWKKEIYEKIIYATLDKSLYLS